MSRKLKTINISIMEKDYPVACPPGQESTLMAAVDQVDRLMQTIKRNGRTVGVERIAVMAAINMAHELLALKEKIKQSTHQSDTASSTPIEPDQPLQQSTADSAPSQFTTQQQEALQKAAEEEAAIAAQLQALTEKLQATLSNDDPNITADAPAETTDTDNQNTDQQTLEAAPIKPLAQSLSDTNAETNPSEEAATEPMPSERDDDMSPQNDGKIKQPQVD